MRWVAWVFTLVLAASCGDRGDDETIPVTPRSYVFSLLEPPGHAPGEPHPFDDCPDGACERDQPAFLFSGEFHEAVVDLRIRSCVGLDLIWARRYRSRTGPNTAQGNGWDFSYNAFVEEISSTEILVHDGNARPALFTLQPSGEYTAPGYYRTGILTGNKRFTLTFADGGTWRFHRLHHTQSAPGKLETITDRNGNEVNLTYDGSGRLTQIRDALNRTLTVAYDGSNRIASVTDFTGRVVGYEYYGASDPDGNPGDLKRVTRQAITGTVTGNDFPNGTTTTYTYSTGSSEPELNGNLLTIRDALGQVYLSNTYASTTNSGDLEFDRLVEQVWGDPTDRIGLSYASVTPSGSNEYAVVKAFVNDRVGRVSEHYFNAEHLEVIRREYTGFADPDLPTTQTANRPSGKLRPTDPDFFETRFAYNGDFRLVGVLHPRGNVTSRVYEGDLNPQANPRVRGNMREMHRDPAGCGTEPTLSTFYEYASGFGNEHGEQNFVTKRTDERGNITEATYDSSGNRTATIHPELDTREDLEYNGVGQQTRHIFPEDQHGVRRETTYTYHTTGARCREHTIDDPTGLALTSTTEWDGLARETRRIDARGNDKLYIYNAQDELVREEDVLHAGVRANTDSIYDANMRLVQVRYDAIDCEGQPMSPAVISTTHEYDILGEDTITRMEIAAGVEIVHEVQLDANRNPLLVRYGEAVNGNDPDNTETLVWDERGLPFQETRAPGTTLASTKQHDYDSNGNEIRLLTGLEGPIRETEHTYDCHDRLIVTVDPMGNRTELDRDAAGNTVEQRLFGELVDVPGSTNNVLLERTTYVYDTMNRVIETTGHHFNPATQTLIGDGLAVTTLIYDGESRVVLEEDANGHVTTHDYDRAGRIIETVDPEGNIVTLAYDPNGNVVQRTLTDRSTIDGSTQVGVWTNAYDTRNNLVATTDPMSNTRTLCYDSMGRMLEEIDPRGNRTLHTYDGQGRLLETAYELTDTGSGGGTVIGVATTKQVWDDSNRLVAREDPNGNVTTYTYDALNRLTEETFANGTQQIFRTYDVHDNVTDEIAPNFTILQNGYDALDRRISVTVFPGPDVGGGTTFESFEYDGRSLPVSATDDDSAVTRTWDSLGAVLSETQEYTPEATPRTITYHRDKLGSPTVTYYPSGRVIERTFDGLRRTRSIREARTTLAELEYLGPSLLRKTYPIPNTQSDYTYDLSRRMLTSHHAEIGGVTIDSRAYAWDPANQKIEEDDLAAGSLTGLRTVHHDSLGRMIDSAVTGSVQTDRVVRYTFDETGNRASVIGDSCAGTYTQTGSDALVNQYTETPCEEWDHDPAGNLVGTIATGGGGRTLDLVYDHRHRLVSATNSAGVQLIFAYDALGRKIKNRRVTASGSVSEHIIVHDDWNVIENHFPTAVFTYVYGDELDDRLELRWGGTSGNRFSYYEDDLGSTVALAHRNAQNNLVIERYAYHDYGVPQFFYNGSPASSGQLGNTYLFAGARWLPDVGLYDLRTRHLDTIAGRFTARDSIGIWGDEDNLGNGYAYVTNSPLTHRDPTGEIKEPKFDGCSEQEEEEVRKALPWAFRYAHAFSYWTYRQNKRKHKKRKDAWNQGNIGKDWFGGYNYTRFKRVRRYSKRVARRIVGNKIRFRCRTTAGLCSGAGNVGWTKRNNWHAAIRLCRKSGSKGHLRMKFFNDNLPRTSGSYFEKSQAKSIVHEVAHNIGPVRDHAYFETPMRRTGWAHTSSGGAKVSTVTPRQASYNADSYAGACVDCYLRGC